MDIGCGRGGDLNKFKFCQPVGYTGVDASGEAIAEARARSLRLHLEFPTRFAQADFATRRAWAPDAPDAANSPPYDVINCQFAIHLAFSNDACARETLQLIADNLVEGGIFLGCLPQYPGRATFERTLVQFPDDDAEECAEEYAVTIDDFTSMCEQSHLYTVFAEPFDVFYEGCARRERDLLQKMGAHAPPDPNNHAFVMQKRTGSTPDK